MATTTNWLMLGLLLESLGKACHVGGTVGGDDAVLGQVAAQRVDGLRPLTDQQIPSLESHGRRLLLDALHGHEAHRGAGCSLRDRLRVGSVVLVAADERLDMDRGDQTHLMPERTNLPRPVVGAPARFHRDQTGRRRSEELEQFPTRQLPAECHRPVGACAMELKDVLRQIQPDDANLRHGRLSPCGPTLRNLGTLMPSEGRP